MIPDNVEKIIMAKEDYDRNVEQLLVEKLKLEKELQRKDNIINELNKDLEYYKHEEELYRYYQQENPRLMNNWNELKKCMKDLLNKANDKTSDLFIYEQNKAIINMFLDKIKELEGK